MTDGSPTSHEGLTSYFKKGALIGKHEMASLISSSVNPAESSSHSLKMTEGSLCFGSTEWSKTTPPFVPNFNPHIKVLSFDRYTAMHQNRVPIGNTAVLTATSADIQNYASTFGGSSISTMWECGTGSLLSPVFNDSQFIFGCFALNTSTQTGAQNTLSTAGESSLLNVQQQFACNPNSQWWVRSRFKSADHDGAEFFVGLYAGNAQTAEWHKGVGNTSQNKIGFSKPTYNDDNVYAAFYNNDYNSAVQLSSSVNYTQDNEVHQVGILWNGKNIKYYHSSCSAANFDYLNSDLDAINLNEMTLIHTQTKGIPTGRALRPAIIVKGGPGIDPKMRFEYLQAAVLSSSKHSPTYP